jgi:hypothetical protein
MMADGSRGYGGGRGYGDNMVFPLDVVVGGGI